MQENSTQLEQQQHYIHLNMRAIEAQKPMDLKFIIVNETHGLSHYRQAAFFDVSLNGNLKLATASGLVSVSDDSPYSVWLNQLAKHFDVNLPFQNLDIHNAPANSVDEWQEWLPEHLLIIPVRDTNNTLLGVSMFARESTWSESEIEQILFLHKSYAYCLAALKHSKKSFSQHLSAFFKLKHWWLATLILITLMFLPVRLSTLAPAEIIALNSFNVAAPQEGVIRSFLVKPNAQVKKGDVLFTLDDTSVVNRYEVAAKALAIAKANALVAQQRAFDDIRGKAELASALGTVQEKQAELNSIQALISRIEVKAERDGIAIFADENDWIGRPIQTGERVLQIADPKQAGLLMWLPVKDALNINAGAPMKMFLHTDPLNPIPAILKQTSYQASLSPDNVSSYRLKGEFIDVDHLPRIGLRGTARISGEWSFLGYYLFRRPIASVREWTGL